MLALALPVLAVRGPPVRVVAEGQQRRDVAVGHQPDVAAAAAVAAVGPPLGTCASRRKEVVPAPPSPPFTCRPHSSTNEDIAVRVGVAPTRPASGYLTRRTGSPPMVASHVVVSLACVPAV